MTQAAILAASGSPGTTTGFKNRIINGNMIIWQRGTSFSAIGYTADRWSFYAGTSPVVSQSSDVPAGFRYSAALSGTGSTGFTQKIESNNVSDLSGQSVTVSFWLKQATGAGSNAIAISLSYATAQDNFGSTTSIGSTNITTTSSWAYYTATFNNLPSGVTNGLQCTIVTNSGSAVAFQLTGVQLEVGTTATNFDFRSYGQELQLCQRYYETMGFGLLGIANSATGIWAQIIYKVQKRANPTIGLYTTTQTWSQFGVADRTSSSVSIGDAARLNTWGSITRIEGFSSITTNAPLGCNTDTVFTLSAEL